MQITCPHCQQVLETDRRLSFCGFCGGSLAQAEPHDAATLIYEPHDTAPALPSTAEPPETIGDYRLLRRLGQGGMGVVYEAEQGATGRRVALKLLSPGIAQDPDSMQRFVREGQSAAAVSHPRATFIFEAGQQDGHPFITMELMPGRTLKDVSEDEGPLPVPRAVDYLLDAIEGLEAAHAAGVIHRDVKPSNCFVASDGRVKIGDFGLSKSLVSNADLTRTGAFLGTPMFAAPEQVRGGAVDARTDIYSLGATLFFLIAQRGPFTGDPAAMIAQIASDPAPRLRTLVPGVAKDLDGIVARTLEKDPARRFANLAQLRRALLPFGSQGMSPAPLGRRMGAYFLDILITGMISGVVSAAVVFSLIFAKILQTASGDTKSFTAVMGPLRSSIVLAGVVSLLLVVSYFAISESRTGSSLGKWLLGLRVVGLDGGRPQMWRAFLRAALVPGLMWLSSIVLIPLQFPDEFGKSAEGFKAQRIEREWVLMEQLLGALGFVPTLLCLVTMRARNGYAGLHDLATRTRVVRTHAPPGAARSLESPVVLPTVAPGAKEFGPFRITGWLGKTAEATIFVARDEVLDRPVWIVIRPPDAPAVPPARAAVGRGTRPRWLQGARTGESRWDAFEAVVGAPLSKVAAGGGLEWGRARLVLLELAEELAAAADDGTLPCPLSLENAWVDRDGRLKLFDAPLEPPGNGIADSARAPADQQPPAVAASALLRLAAQMLTAAPPGDRLGEKAARILPSHAHELLRGLAERPDERATLDWAASSLRDSLKFSPVLGRSERLVALGVSMGTEYSLYQVPLSLLLLALLKVQLVAEPVQIATVLALVVALPTAVGYLSRGGPVFRLLAIDVRRADGRPAGRGRCGLRNLIAWLPALSAFFLNAVLAPCLPELMPTAGSNSTLQGDALQAVLVSLVTVGGGLLLLIHAFGGCCALGSPQRGIQDLLAGTRLVPR